MKPTAERAAAGERRYHKGAAGRAMVLLTALSVLSTVSCRGPAPQRILATADRTGPPISGSLQADGLIDAQRASMAAEDQKRAEAALRCDTTKAGDRRESPLRRPVRRRP
jgi:hypothetical protein